MMKPKTFTFGEQKLHLHFLTVVGSTLHQLTMQNSDIDVKGVFVWDEVVSAGLKTPKDNLDKNSTRQKVEEGEKSDWQLLIEQLNNEFDLNLEEDDDLVLFEARKFMTTALKNDFNTFDMLFSTLSPVFCTTMFQKVLDHGESFLNMEYAKSRFTGMAENSLKTARSKLQKDNQDNLAKSTKMFEFEDNTNHNHNQIVHEPGVAKPLAKSIQMLHSLIFLLNRQEFSPVLPSKERLEVLEIKKGLVPFYIVKVRFDELMEEVQKLLNDKNKMIKSADVAKVNELLVLVTLSTFKNKQNKHNNKLSR